MEKNLTKMIQIRRQNVSKSRAGGGLGGSWAALGQLLVSHGSKASLGCLLYGSWAALGRLLSRLGHLLGGSWAVCGTKLGRLGSILAIFWCDFLTKMEPGWFQNSVNHKTYIKIA